MEGASSVCQGVAEKACARALHQRVTALLTGFSRCRASNILERLSPCPHLEHNRHEQHPTSANETSLDELIAEAKIHMKARFEGGRFVPRSSDHTKSFRDQ